MMAVIGPGRTPAIGSGTPGSVWVVGRAGCGGRGRDGGGAGRECEWGGGCG